MVEKGRKKITPADADECIKFVIEHREEIAQGLYDLHVEKTWAKALDADDLLLIARHCPSARPAVAAATSLEALADDPLSAVRMAVAGNLSTPTASLEKLARDTINYVRWGVANNEQTPPSLLKELAQDADFHVRN